MENKHTFGEAIFSPGFDFSGPHLVEASAGTGKTHNIQNIYARLVAEKGLRVEQIQVMTFTEAATKELRDRIRLVLRRLAALYAGTLEEELEGMDEEAKEKERKRLESLRACARANLGGGDGQADRTARANVEQALMEFDQSSISTIHGFCLRALTRFAFETGSGFDEEFKNDKSAAIRSRVRDWWRKDHGDVPEDIRPGLRLETLSTYAAELSGKVDWTLDDGAEGDAKGWMLKKAAEIVEGYESERSLRETRTFDDLLRALREALDDPRLGERLAEKLRGEFKAVLVDEFQDTDPVQFDIFRRAFIDVADGPKPSVFFVGDPKQAIYAFRGGDIYAYTAAKRRKDVRENTFELARNFRSTSRLIDAVNAIFKDRDGQKTFGDQEIAYPEDLKSSDKAALKLEDGQDDPAPFRIAQLATAGMRDSYVVQVVLDTLAEFKGRPPAEGIGPKDMAILVSSNATGAKIRNALRARGVQAVLRRSGNVFSGRAAREFIQVLLAMAGTGGKGQVRAALSTCFFGATAEELADVDRLAVKVGAFAQLRRTWETRGFEAAFAELEKLCDLRSRLAREPDGERLLADVFQILDLAGTAVRTTGPSPDALLDWMAERIRLAGDDRKDDFSPKEKSAEADAEEYARQLESDRDALKIMTVHASKGLEFPVVFVVATSGQEEKEPYFYHDGDSQLHVGLSGDAAAAAKREQDAERTRFFYVAFTRGSKRTVVVTQQPKLGTPLDRLLANARANGAGAENLESPIRWIVDPAIREDPGRYEPEGTSEEPLAAAEEPPAYGQEPTKGSYSMLSPKGQEGAGDGRDVDADDGTEGDTDAGEPIFAIRGGAKTGTCWHEILEHLPFDAQDDEILAATRESMERHGCGPKESAAFEAEAALVAGMMKAALGHPLEAPDGERFSLRDVPMAERLSEWEFDFSSRDAAATTARIAEILEEEWGGDDSRRPFLAAVRGWTRPIPKGFFTGFLDLMFRHNGYYYVVDWKSNGINRRKSGFSRPGVEREMAREGYFFQYLLYSAVLRTYLKETLGEGYSWERNFGGVRYYFLRGMAAGADGAVFADRPGERLLSKLAKALGLED